MLKLPQPNKLLLVLAAFCMGFFMFMRLFQPGPEGWKTVITSDGRGYYAYLPSLVLHGDLTFQSVASAEDKMESSTEKNAVYLVPSGNTLIDKYWAGVALLLLPFFLIATFFTWILGLPVDGFSFFFQLFAGIGGLFYFISGLIFLKKILEKAKADPKVIAITIIAISLGTNIFYYTLWQPAMSHVFSFFAINGFIWSLIRNKENPRNRDLILSGLFLGLILLIRPVNGVILLLVPFLFSSAAELRNFIRALRPGKWALFVLSFLLLFSIQPLIWYMQTGNLFLWSYRQEGFDWTSPQFLNVLFGFRKGLFIYSPILLLAVPGLFLYFRKPVFRIVSLVAFWTALTWILSSWWNWYYGDSFGMRPFIDFYGVFAILIADFLMLTRRFRLLPAMGLVVGLFVFLNLFQTWQYTHNVIHPSGMNREKYFHVLLRADSAAINCLGGNDDLPFFGCDMHRPVRIYYNNFEKDLEGWNNMGRKLARNAWSGKYTGDLGPESEFSPALNVPMDSIGRLPSRFFCSVQLMIRDSVAGASNSAYFVVSIDSFDFHHLYYYCFPVNEFPHLKKGDWRKENYGFNLPEILNPKTHLKAYVWAPHRKPFYIDDFRILFYAEKKNVIQRK